MKNESKVSKARKEVIQKNKELRKKYEEIDIKLGYAKPKKNYTGFEEDE